VRCVNPPGRPRSCRMATIRMSISSWMTSVGTGALIGKPMSERADLEAVFMDMLEVHVKVKQSKIHRIAGAGHMVQQSVTDEVMSAINEAAAA
jgi:hypothetical protein